MSEIQANLQMLKAELKEVKLVAVSKYSPNEDVLTAYKAGQKDFGENKVQDLLVKATSPELGNLQDIVWHFIGPLQSNKVKKLFEIPHLGYIHSLHNLKVLKLFLIHQQESHKRIKFFLQYNSSHEDEKQGFSSLAQLSEAMNLIIEFQQVDNFCGLMTMAILRTDDWQTGARKCFQECHQMAEELKKQYHLTRELELSMGMSRDYQIAIDEGATWVRVGSSIFK